MTEKECIGQGGLSPEDEILDDDIYEAMKDITGYLDVTPGDLKELFRLAYRHALQRISSAVKAKDIMTMQVHSVRLDTSLKDVADLMAEKTISGVPVLDMKGKVTGVISEKDFLLHMGAKDTTHVMGVIADCLKGKGCAATPIRSVTAEKIMSSPAITVTEAATLFDIMDIFSRKHINRVPVVNDSNDLVGIVSRADIMRAQVMKGKATEEK